MTTRGRPPKPAKDVLGEMVQIRAQKGQVSKWRRAAIRDCFDDLSAWMRTVVDRAASQALRPKKK